MQQKPNRWKIAGKELVHGNIGNAVKAMTVSETLLHSKYRGMSGVWFFGNDNIDRYFDFDGLSSSLKAYQTCAPLNAIIHRTVDAYINGKTWVLNNKGKEIENEHATRLRKIIDQPNPLQNWPEFEAQAKVYKKVFGYNIVLAMTPLGFDNSYAKAIWNIPPHLVEIEYSDANIYSIKTRDDLIKKIWLKTPNGIRSELDKRFISIHKTTEPSFGSPLLSESPIRVLEQQINNIIGAYESRGTLISYRGSLGILSPEIDDSGSKPLEEEDKEEIHADFAKYGLRKGQNKFIITTAAMKWQQMGIPTSSLMLFEEIEDDIMRICDKIGYPYRLMASDKSASYNDVSECKKKLYQDTIIPESILDYADWNRFFNTAEYRLKIDKDYAHIEALQANKKNLASARLSMGQALEREFKNNWIKLNRVLEILEEDTLGAEGEKYYSDLVAEGKTFGQAQSQNQNNGNSETTTEGGQQAQS